MLRALLASFLLGLILVIGFGAAGTHPAALERLADRDARAGAQVLGVRGQLAAARGAAAVRSALSGGARVWFPELDPAAAREAGAHRLPGWRRQSPDALSSAIARGLSAPVFENVRLIGLLALARLTRLAIYLAAALPLLVALAADGLLARRLSVHRMGSGRPSVFSGIGHLAAAAAAGVTLAALLPVALPEAFWWGVPVVFGLLLRAGAARWHRLPG